MLGQIEKLGPVTRHFGQIIRPATADRLAQLAQSFFERLGPTIHRRVCERVPAIGRDVRHLHRHQHPAHRLFMPIDEPVIVVGDAPDCRLSSAPHSTRIEQPRKGRKRCRCRPGSPCHAVVLADGDASRWMEG